MWWLCSSACVEELYMLIATGDNGGFYMKIPYTWAIWINLLFGLLFWLIHSTSFMFIYFLRSWYKFGHVDVVWAAVSNTSYRQVGWVWEHADKWCCYFGPCYHLLRPYHYLSYFHCCTSLYFNCFSGIHSRSLLVVHKTHILSKLTPVP